LYGARIAGQAIEETLNDIFISYAREDENWVQTLVRGLEERGLSVFWDRNIPAGQTWRTHIGRSLNNARCVVVVWSRHSIESQWVAEEADEGKQKGILVPVLLDAVAPPIGFRSIQAADLSDWQPGRESSRFLQFVGDVERLCSKPKDSTSESGLNATQTIPSPRGETPELGKSRWRKALIHGAITVAVVGGFLYWNSLNSPQPRPVKIAVVRLSIAKQMTITNNAKMRIKVLAFNAGDTIRLIARPGGDWTLDPGQSARYERGNYWFKVFRPGSVVPPKLDAFLAESRGIIGTDVLVTSDNRGVAVRGVPPKPVTVTNNTTESLRVCASAPATRPTCWTIAAKDIYRWDSAPAEFTVRVFRPQSPDKPIAVESNVPNESTVKIDERS
jgi:hypothetical protein